MVDRVIGLRKGTVASLVAHLQLEAEVHLLRGLHREGQVLSVLDLAAPGVGIQRELGIHQRPPLLHEPLNALSCRFLVGRQGDDDVAVGNEVLLPEANERSHEERSAKFVVHGAATVVIAVLLAEGIRIERPVLLPGINNIQVRDEEDRLGRCVPTAKPRDEVLVLGRKAEDLYILHRHAGRDEPLGHRLGGLASVSGRVARVDLDELLEDFPFECARGVRTLSREHGGREENGDRTNVAG